MALCQEQRRIYFWLLLGLSACRADQAESTDVVLVLQPGTCISSSEGSFIIYKATFYNQTAKPYLLPPSLQHQRPYSILSIRVQLPQGLHTFPLFFQPGVTQLTLPAQGQYSLTLQLANNDLRSILPEDSICQLLRYPFTVQAQDTAIRVNLTTTSTHQERVRYMP